MSKLARAALVSSALSSLLPLSPAFAQSSTPPAPTAAEQGAAAQVQPDTTVGDIIVTAQRRTENIQKSSLAISVINNETIARAGITSTADLTKVLPGVQIGTAGPVPQIFIRGVGDFGSTAITNPAVALNVGGVYFARPAAVGGTFFDLDRIEVLKGPQGTLYGRNASAGAVNLLPTRPKLGKTQMSVNVEAGNYKSINSDGAVNLPIGQTLALRAAYQVSQRDGYLSDGSNDDIHQSARVQLLWQPSAATSLLLYGSYYHAGGIGNGYALYDPAGNPFATPARAPTRPFDPWTSVTDPRGAAILAATAPPPIFRPANPNDLRQNNRFWNFQADLTTDLGFATLTVIPSYQKATLDYHIYPALDYSTRAGAGVGAPERSEAYSGEVRLSNDSKVLKWVVGAFYFHEDQDANSTLNNGLAQFTSISADIATKSIAVFGQATYSVTDRLRIIGGLRYTDDRRNLTNGLRTDYNAPGAPSGRIAGSAKTDKVNYKGGFEFDVAPENLVFGTVSTGFKAGGVQNGVAAAFRPETLQAFELGSRNRFFGNRFQLNIEAFYWRYNDHQEQVIGPDDLGIVSGLIRNAGKARAYGVDVDAVMRLTSADTLSVNGEYNNSKYTQFSYLQPLAFLAPGTTGCTVTPNGQIGVAGPIAAVDCAGRPLSHAPKWSGGVTYNHHFALGSSGALDLSGDMKFASSRYLSVDFIPNTFAKAYQTYGASVTYTAPGDALTVAGFVRNISNAAVYTSAAESSFAASYVAAAINPPRTYGVRIGYRFR